jgi:hypothetical protein
MKKLIVAAILATVSLAARSAPASASVVGRQWHQQNRILHGVASGRLTAGETYRLERREASIRREANVMRSMHGGHLTPFNKFVLNQRLNRTSGAIWRAKHNWAHY